MILIRSGRPEEAEAHARLAVQPAPPSDQPGMHPASGEILFRVNNSRRGSKCSNLSVSLDPADADVHMELGYAYDRIGRPERGGVPHFRLRVVIQPCSLLPHAYYVLWHPQYAERVRT